LAIKHVGDGYEFRASKSFDVKKKQDSHPRGFLPIDLNDSGGNDGGLNKKMEESLKKAPTSLENYQIHPRV
jgi:hypothetical protein